VAAHEKWNHMTRFLAPALPHQLRHRVVTGIVQEFQFGMNWSLYSRYVGSVFGAPLAIEGLLAFFLESTFLGIWIFGKGRVSPRIHLASIWLVGVGNDALSPVHPGRQLLDAAPVGYKVVGNRAIMTNFWAVMTNSTLVGSFLHVLFSALVTSALLILGVSAWHLLKDRRAMEAPQPVFAASAKLALVVGSGRIVPRCSRDNQARVMERQQPMKMGRCRGDLQHPGRRKLLAAHHRGPLGHPIFQIRLPHLLSVLADNSWNGPVQGINQIQAKDVAKSGPGSYKPILWVTYWTFRIMVGCGSSCSD